MVSGFLTSPCDHDRIISGDAIEMRMALNASGFLGFSKIPKRSSIPDCSLSPARLAGLLLEQFHVEAERLQLFDHHVERLRQARLQRVFNLDDGLSHASAS